MVDDDSVAREEKFLGQSNFAGLGGVDGSASEGWKVDAAMG